MLNTLNLVSCKFIFNKNMSKVVLGIHSDCFIFRTVCESINCIMREEYFVDRNAEERINYKK